MKKEIVKWMKMQYFKKLFLPFKWRVLLLGCFAILFSGCLTHYVVDGSVRLQLGNETENYTIESLSILKSDSSEKVVWMDETILPGEKSRVREMDFVGRFKVQVVYGEWDKNALKSKSFKDTVFSKRFDGGSIFLQFTEKDGILKIKER